MNGRRWRNSAWIRGATGDNLKARSRISARRLCCPRNCLTVWTLSGCSANDAAHIDSRVFNEVGKEEVEVGIDVAKAVLKAVYQYASLVGRLTALKATEEPPA